MLMPNAGQIWADFNGEMSPFLIVSIYDLPVEYEKDPIKVARVLDTEGLEEVTVAWIIQNCKLVT
jgi:hypothetical protein